MDRYSKDHEWVRVEGDVAIIGITEHAQQQLGDVVFVELPEVGRRVKAGEACAVVESVKAASDVYAPVSGEVVAINAPIVASPILVNEDAQGEAWFYKIHLADPSELAKLMDKPAYDEFVEETA